MGWRVVFSARSKDDLQKIVEHIARNDAPAARRFGLRLIEQAESISQAPESGVRLFERPGARFLPFRSYLIIYRPEPANQTVRILRFGMGRAGSDRFVKRPWEISFGVRLGGSPAKKKRCRARNHVPIWRYCPGKPPSRMSG
jgi:plasmid stabilization system protein ParE